MTQPRYPNRPDPRPAPQGGPPPRGQWFAQGGPPPGRPPGPPQAGPFSGEFGPQGAPYVENPTMLIRPTIPPDLDNDPIPRRRIGRKLLGVLGVLVLLAGGGVAAYLYYDQEVRTAPAGAGTGSCIKINSASATDADIQTIDCEDPAALYKVAIRQTTQTCPDNAYDSYTETSTGARRATSTVTLCLTLNVTTGECLSNLDNPENLTRVACTDPTADTKVTKVTNGTADENACDPATTTVVVYPKPPTTLCFGRPAP